LCSKLTGNNLYEADTWKIVEEGRMSESEYEDGSEDDGQVMETDSLEDLRVSRRKSTVLFTVLTVVL
jgi:hypothetical protein